MNKNINGNNSKLDSKIYQHEVEDSQQPSKPICQSVYDLVRQPVSVMASTR